MFEELCSMPHGRAIKVGHAADILERVDRALIEKMCSPTPTSILNSPQEREQMARRLLMRAHTANREGAFSEAAALFEEAACLEPDNINTLLSHLSMRLKLGDADTVVACYMWLLEHRDLTPKAWEHIRRKLREANQQVVESSAISGLSNSKVVRNRFSWTMELLFHFNL